MASNRNRVALVGKIGSGKTTLIQRLSEEELHYSKTQMVTYTNKFIDTPGEFLDLPYFKSQTIAVSYDAGLLLMVASASDGQNTIPPNFVFTYNLPTIGVVTKMDRKDAKPERAQRFLQYGGVNKKNIYRVSAMTGEGIEALQSAIHDYIERMQQKMRRR